MINDLTVGWAALGVPLLILGLVLFGKSRAIVFFYVAALAVGLGYLTSTGSVQDIGREAQRIVNQQLGAAAEPAAPAESAPPARPENPVSTVPAP